PRRVGYTRLYRRLDLLLHRLRDEAIVQRRYRDALVEVRLNHVPAITRLIAVHPAAAVDQKYQRRGPIRLGLPEVELLPLRVLAVHEIGRGRRRPLGRRLLRL